MKEQFTQKRLLILLGAVILGLVVAFAYSFTTSNNKINYLEDEKELLIENLQLMEMRIDSLSAHEELNTIELQASKERVSILLDSIGKLHANISHLRKFKSELDRLKVKYSWLRTKNDLLNDENGALNSSVGNSKTKIEALEKDSEEMLEIKAILEEKNKELEDQVRKKSLLNIKDTEANAFKVKSNQDISRTSRASSVEKLRACFTIIENPNLINEEKTIYIQFIDPQGTVVTDEGKYTTNRGVKFSKKTKLEYNGDKIEVCDFITLTKGSLISGQYTLIIYEEKKILSKTIFQLK